MRDDQFVEEHESFGLLQCNRINGNADFFGSRLKNHGTYIALRIKEGVRIHDLHQDWYHDGKMIVEVRMTNAQFVQLITTMNMGPGVPCTIEHRHTEGFARMDDLPRTHMSEAAHIQKSFKKDQKEFVDKVKASIEKAEEALDTGRVNKKTRGAVMNVLHSVLQEMESNLPFRVRSFEEATEKVVTDAKTEVEAFVMDVAVRTGLEELKKLSLKAAETREPERDGYMDMLAEGYDPQEEGDK